MANFTELYVHLVWATWERLPLLRPEIEARVHGAIEAKAVELRCRPLAIGGIEDHVHLVCQLHPTVAVADLARQVKGVSSHLVTHAIEQTTDFKWQGGYGAFSFRRSDVPQLCDYVHRQREHHAAGRLIPSLENWGSS
jgi:REP element-mobilizing transposase RayT